MWRTSFGGVNDFGLGSAIAVFLFLLVIPVLLLNVRRFRREALMATAAGHCGGARSIEPVTAAREGVGTASSAPWPTRRSTILLVVVGVLWLVPTLGLLHHVAAARRS